MCVATTLKPAEHWSGLPDSNWRPTRWERVALPTELNPRSHQISAWAEKDNAKGEVLSPVLKAMARNCSDLCIPASKIPQYLRFCSVPAEQGLKDVILDAALHG